VRVRSETPIEAVNLMTAHRSKGLEFKHVYIHGAIDSAWGERVRARSRLISYPENLPLAPSGDSIDERLRLFFVAMTRARDSLTISYSILNDNDKPTLKASFLAGEGWDVEQVKQTKTPQALAEHLERQWYLPLVSLPQQSMQQLLASTLESYKLSATHLNNFIDVTRGGPQSFLLQNLLHFPQSMSPSAAYGSAIHRTLQRAHSHLSSTKKRKPIEDILHDFEKSLKDMYLDNSDHVQYLQRGTDNLSAFFATNYALFSENQQTELSFGSQQSRLGKAHLTGVLDLVDIDKEAKTVTVTDYKTGKPSLNWNGKTDYEKIKLHKYRQQLMFYKLLVENSREYSQLTVDTGVIQFVEPMNGGAVVALSIAFDDTELDQFSQLVQAVFSHITHLDLPDTSTYASDYSGVLAFEDMLRSQLVDN
jgi:DNA helicase-2/ATP-dependent DNA helicase PcrA